LTQQLLLQWLAQMPLMLPLCLLDGRCQAQRPLQCLLHMLNWCTKGHRRASSNSSRLLHRLLLTLQHAGKRRKQGLARGMLFYMHVH
jgi:hypothetical protein